jgi:hypothetical protein
MALLGQASGGWTESSSALRLLHVGIRNTVGILTADSFTQTNPPSAVIAASTSNGMDTATLGVLSGSVAFSRGDAAGGSNEIGGTAGVAASTAGFAELGVFINTAVGNAYENTPGPASGKGPYVSGNGTYANSLFETLCQAGALATGYTTGDSLFASVNGYLLTHDSAGIPNPSSTASVGNVVPATDFMLGVIAPIMAILKMPADAVQPEIVYDQRI